MLKAEGISEKTIETINEKLKKSSASSCYAYIDYYDEDENVVEVKFLSAGEKAQPENIESSGTEGDDFNRSLVNLVETFSHYQLSGIRLLFNEGEPENVSEDAGYLRYDAMYDKILTENNFFYEITDYIFEDINAVLNMSLIELAEKLYVSKATVTRYYKKLGFESYRDFCVQLAKEAALFESGENKQADLIRQDSTTAEIIQTVASITKQAVNENMKNIRESEIQNFATLIHNYKRIYIYGAGEAGYSASSIFLSRLLELGKDVSRIDYIMISQFAENLHNKNSLIIIIAYEDFNKKILEFVKKLESKDIPVLIISGPFGYEMEQYAIRTLHNTYEEKSPKMVSIGSRVGIEFLLDIVYLYLLKMNFDKKV